MPDTPLRSPLLRVALCAVAASAAALLSPLVTSAGAKAGKAAPVSAEGVLDVGHGDDFEHGRARWYAALDTPRGRVAIRFQGAYPTELAGARVRVHGRRSGQAIEVRRLAVLEAPPRQSGRATAQTVNAAVILLNFRNDRSEPWTTAAARAVAFTNADSVSAYYDEATYGRVRLTGTVFGWFTIPYDRANCGADFSAWGAAAKQQLAASGVDLAQFQKFVFAWPRADCGWSGLGGGANAYLNGTIAFRTFAHEIGHTFGLSHANSMTCTDAGARVALSSTCTRSEYGDPFDVMGGSQRLLTNNRYRHNRTWLTWAQDVSSTGTYTLAPAEGLLATAPQLLTVARSDGSSLSLEFRQPLGLFDTFSSADPVANGVSMRFLGVPGTTGARVTGLLDTTPSTSSFGDAPLALGRTFTDAAGGVSITTVALSPFGATVDIVVGAGAPTAPTTSPPVNTALPSIGGDAVDGALLAATTGGWTSSPTGYAYQWRRCDSAGGSCSVVAGAASATYTVSTEDVGATLRVAVTASNSGGSTTATSPQTAPIAARPPSAPSSSTATATYSGTLGKKTPTLEFQLDAGSGRLDATVKLGGRNSTARVELLDAGGNVVSAAEGGSPLLLSAALSVAGLHRFRVSAPGHKGGLSVELTATYQRP